jgi:hypothetical protein
LGLALASAFVRTLSARPAEADTTYDPVLARMAITDRSTAADIQPRAWLVTNGTTVSPYYLVTKIPDLNQNTWATTGINGVDSGIDAVSWTDGSTQRQRVFYTSAGALYMASWDNDMSNGTTRITPASFPYMISGTDLAAVTFMDGSSRRIAVAGGASQSGNAGYICVWESGDLGGTWTPTCSTDRPLPASNPSTHDIVGVNLSGTTTVAFYFRNLFATLSRVRRTGTNTYTNHEELSVPTGIQPSIAAIESQVSGRIELAVAGGDNKLYTARILPTDSAPSWGARAALPGGATPWNSPAAVSMVKYHGTDANGQNPYTRTTLFVAGNNLGLHVLSTADDAGTWGTSWIGPHFSPSGWLGSVGAVTTTTGDPYRLPRLFVAAGYPTYTLQEYFNWFGQGYAFRDHIKYQVDPVGVGNSNLSVAETSAAADTQLGIMSSTDRNYPSPWLVRLRSSTDGANTYDLTDSVISPFTGGAYLTDSTVATGGGRLHHTSLEIAFSSSCTPTATESSNQVIYRRGTSASAIAALNHAGADAFLIDSSTSSTTSALDHPWEVVTNDQSGTTTHVVYYSVVNSNQHCTVAGGFCYWKLAPGDVQSGPVLVNPITSLSDGPARAIRGANNEIYGYADVHSGDWTQICTLKNAFAPGGVQYADCTKMVNQSPAPAGMSSGPYIYVGPPLGTTPPGTKCTMTFNGGKHYKCFDIQAETAVVADPVTPYKVYVAYVVANANTSTSAIYYSRSSGGSSWGTWTPPVALTPVDTYVYYDPMITVDTDGTIFVTYSQITPVSVNESGAATVYVTMSTDGGQTWSSPMAWSNWNTSSIQFHCHRDVYFMGDYRNGTVLGNRAYLPYQNGGSTSSPYTYRGHWMSRWTLAN